MQETGGMDPPVVNIAGAAVVVVVVEVLEVSIF